MDPAGPEGAKPGRGTATRTLTGPSSVGPPGPEKSPRRKGGNAPRPCSQRHFGPASAGTSKPSIISDSFRVPKGLRAEESPFRHAGIVVGAAGPEPDPQPGANLAPGGEADGDRSHPAARFGVAAGLRKWECARLRNNPFARGRPSHGSRAGGKPTASAGAGGRPAISASLAAPTYPFQLLPMS